MSEPLTNYLINSDVHVDGWYNDAILLYLSMLSFSQASGVRVGTLLEMGVGLVLAVVVGFVYSWILTFVVLGIMPVIVISAALHVQLTTGANQGQYTALQTAREIAVESIEVIDTVVALGAEERFYNRFKTEVEKPYR